MNRLTFTEVVRRPADPGRADVALFVGYCVARPGPEPEGAPVAVESWGDFDRRFDWNARAYALDDGATVTGSTWLGAAVRSFFVQGGRRCYVVALGDCPAVTGAPENRRRLVQPLLPGFEHGTTDFSPVDAATWRGAWWLIALPDVSFLCLPDLPELVRAEAPKELPEAPAPVVEQWVECSDGYMPQERSSRARLLPAPRCDEEGYRIWGSAVRLAARFLRRYRPDVQLVAAVPMPDASTHGTLIRILDEGADPCLRRGLDDGANGIASAWVQLVYPWLRTGGSARLPEALEPPDGVLVGLLARHALARGSYRSAVPEPVLDAWDVAPRLRGDEIYHHSDNRRSPLIERVTLFGALATRVALLSDVTASLDESYRPAAVNRLVSLLVRAVQRIGIDVLFEPSGERVWEALRTRIEGFLDALFAAEALRGANARQAYTVRCDRTTMSQNDLDNGRLVCAVTIAPATPIERIDVLLALGQSGLVSVLPPRPVEAQRELEVVHG